MRTVDRVDDPHRRVAGEQARRPRRRPTPPPRRPPPSPAAAWSARAVSAASAARSATVTRSPGAFSAMSAAPSRPKYGMMSRAATSRMIRSTSAPVRASITASACHPAPAGRRRRPGCAGRASVRARRGGGRLGNTLIHCGLGPGRPEPDAERARRHQGGPGDEQDGRSAEGPVGPVRTPPPATPAWRRARRRPAPRWPAPTSRARRSRPPTADGHRVPPELGPGTTSASWPPRIGEAGAEREADVAGRGQVAPAPAPSTADRADERERSARAAARRARPRRPAANVDEQAGRPGGEQPGHVGQQRVAGRRDHERHRPNP